MASQDPDPGDVISIGGSSDDESIVSKKRGASDERRGSSPGVPSHVSKKARLSGASSVSQDMTGSEEGEVAENDGEDKTPQKGEASSNTNNDSGAILSDDAPLYKSGDVSLRLPSISQRPDWSWINRFEDWARVFYHSNRDNAGSITAAVVTDAFVHYIDKESKLKPPKKKTARQTAEKMKKSGDTESIITGLGIANAASESEDAYEPEEPENVNGATEPQTNGHESAAPAPAPEMVEVEPSTEQLRYFPSALRPGMMCLACGREGHIAANCPSNKCKFCGKDEHWDFICSTMPQRCDKCHQLGHEASKCVEKLALTMDEGLACICCGATDHLEENCTETWRSFHPDGETVKTVAYIGASCANCGSRNHFVSDCAQRGKKHVNPTWTLRNRNLYVNPDSDGVAIEEVELDSGATRRGGRGGVQMRGHATRPTHIHYSESDDSDVEFIGQKASTKPAPSVGQIRLASNIQLPSKPTFNPPLPPGPPPPGPPPDRYIPPPPHPPPPPPPPGMTGYNSFQPLSHPPSSLPARPPPSRDYRNVPPPTAPRHIAEPRGRGGRSARRGPSPPPSRGKRGGGSAGGGGRGRDGGGGGSGGARGGNRGGRGGRGRGRGR